MIAKMDCDGPLLTNEVDDISHWQGNPQARTW